MARFDRCCPHDEVRELGGLRSDCWTAPAGRGRPTMHMEALRGAGQPVFDRPAPAGLKSLQSATAAGQLLRHRQDLRRGPIQTAAHAPAVSDPSNEVPGRLLTTVLQHVKAAARPGAHRSPTLFSAVSTTTQSRRSEASQRRRCVAPERTRATLAGGSSGWPAELVRRRRSAASRYR